MRKRQKGILLAQKRSRRIYEKPVPPGLDSSNVAERADNRVIELIAKMGADTKKVREVKFFLYVPDEENAYRVASKLQQDGFEVHVSKSASDMKWLCLAVKNMVPTTRAINALRRYFVHLVKPFQGEYDGWGTGIDDGTWDGK
ncbi:MAG: ribonuclease E inhibitor RraB [Ignavibacteriales bacterium]|nr:ribonuclease E inhibitor RraB [Ignavibacteriales bacterium]